MGEFRPSWQLPVEASWFVAGAWKCSKEAGDQSGWWSYASILRRRRAPLVG